MQQTFLFYDLETTGTNKAGDRIIQFAAQRTDQNFNINADPLDLKIQLPDDILPHPQATLTTGKTPQDVSDGIPELELARILYEKVFTQGTTVIGFNNIDFDDNFIRYLFWRNFFDPYEWAWRDSRSRWDLLNPSRMVHALRPDGINWPEDGNGNCNHKLEKLAEANNIQHDHAHDGLSDVLALIDWAKLLRNKQSKMFDYLLSMRDKNKVNQLVNLTKAEPFVLTATRNGATYHYTSVACSIAEGPTNNTLITYNLRYDPTPWLNFSAAELAALRFTSYEELDKRGLPPFPLHSIATNACPTVAPIGVLDEQDGWDKLALNPQTVRHNMDILRKNPQFIDEAKMAYQAENFPDETRDVEERMYDGFLNDADRQTANRIHNADAKLMATWDPYFHDERLPQLFIHFKARNFPETLSQAEAQVWETYRTAKLAQREPVFMEELEQARTKATPEQQGILDQLVTWQKQVMSKK